MHCVAFGHEASQCNSDMTCIPILCLAITLGLYPDVNKAISQRPNNYAEKRNFIIANRKATQLNTEKDGLAWDKREVNANPPFC